jgi:hypothetical protein
VLDSDSYIWYSFPRKINKLSKKQKTHKKGELNMGKSVLSNLEDIQEQLQIFNNFTELTVYKVTGRFTMKDGSVKETTYHACNVQMDFDNEWIVLYDAELIVLSKMFEVPNLFLIDSIKAAHKESLGTGIRMKFTFEFENGYIEMVSKEVKSSLSQYEEHLGEVLSEEEERAEFENMYRRYYEDNEW